MCAGTQFPGQPREGGIVTLPSFAPEGRGWHTHKASERVIPWTPLGVLLPRLHTEEIPLTGSDLLLTSPPPRPKELIKRKALSPQLNKQMNVFIKAKCPFII